MFLFPFHADVPMSRWPVANFALIGVTVFAFFYVRLGDVPTETVRMLVLTPGQPSGLVGHLLLHGGLFHLFGNMLFLWVFGNAVCAKVGNLVYLQLYIVLGVIAGVAHMVLNGGPAIGASGAVNGIVGMYAVLYPQNNVSCFYWIFIRFGTFHVSSIWMILYWLAFDIWGAASGAGHVAYWAHIGGFAAGFVLISTLLYFEIVRMGSTERSLYGVFRGG